MKNKETVRQAVSWSVGLRSPVFGLALASFTPSLHKLTINSE